MKYYRLSFRSQDRLTGSTYSNPKFVIDLPSNTFGNTRGGVCKMVLENFSGYAGDKTTAKTSPVEQICFSFKNNTSQNSVQTLDVGNFGASKGISFIDATNLSDITKTFAYYHFDNKNHKEENALIIPCATFNNNILEFDLKYIDGNGIDEPVVAYRYYVFCLGIYVDDEE